MFDVKKALIQIQGGRDYLPVAQRLVWFREEHPDWSIVTEPVMVDVQSGYAIFKATVSDADGKPIGSGTKMETARGFGDYVEKAETGAIGRALAVCGYGTQFAPELEEGDRIVDSPQPISGNRPTLRRASPRQESPGPSREPSSEAAGTSAGETSSVRHFCSNPECGREITRGQHEYSSKTFGKALCPICQRQEATLSKK